MVSVESEYSEPFEALDKYKGRDRGNNKNRTPSDFILLLKVDFLPFYIIVSLFAHSKLILIIYSQFIKGLQR